jgi:hypothetical protein
VLHAEVEVEALMRAVMAAQWGLAIDVPNQLPQAGVDPVKKL